jgi:methyl-accepting chemotaxis protein
MERLGTLFLQADTTLLRRHRSGYLIIVALVIALGTVLSLVLASRLKEVIENPITHLALTSQLVSEQKDYSIRAVKHYDDEVGHLVDEFNEMLTQIEQRDRALQDGHDALVGRVNQRTKELRQENEEHRRTGLSLEKEIQERKKSKQV